MKEAPKLFSYVVSWDAGLAPNPYWEHCTLAVCKSQIRRTAKEGDWIVGFSPKRMNYRLVYAMRVAATLSFAEYFGDRRFEEKKPVLSDVDMRRWLGDNFYRFGDDGCYKQLPSAHSRADGSEDEAHKRGDLSGRYVLVGDEYYYYGASGREVPNHLDYLLVGRGYRCQFSQREVMTLIRYVERLVPGVNGEPRDFERALKRYWDL